MTLLYKASITLTLLVSRVNLTGREPLELSQATIKSYSRFIIKLLDNTIHFSSNILCYKLCALISYKILLSSLWIATLFSYLLVTTIRLVQEMIFVCGSLCAVSGTEWYFPYCLHCIHSLVFSVA